MNTQPTPTQAPYIRAEGICTEKDYTPTQPQAEEWEEQLMDLPAINYNLYIGAGRESCDNCLEFDDAVKQVKQFISDLLSKERERIIQKIDDSYGADEALLYGKFLKIVAELKEE